jgi:hypothetical protein
MKSREVRLARIPRGGVAAADFEIVETEIAEPAQGHALIRNLWMTLDPYMRLALSPRAGFAASKSVGAVMDGAAVGIVETSQHPDLPVGTHVISPTKGWREAYPSDGKGLQRVDPALGPLSWHLGVLGMTGITAYIGVEYILKPAVGETVFVSGGAGAVGSIACQLAKKRGCRVLATAGSDAKADWLMHRLGVDAAVNYTLRPILDFLKSECPNGLDAYFDNVGGPVLDAALLAMKPFGRAAICGAMSLYNEPNYRAGPTEFFSIVEKNVTLTGFNVTAYMERAKEIVPALATSLKDGTLIAEETVRNGIENAPAAFVSLLKGESIGKTVLRL